MRTASPEMAPRTSAPSPTVIERLTTSPSMVPSIWMSPLQIRSPLILRSGLMIDGAAARDAAARDVSAVGAGLGVAAGVDVDLLSFENILACLHEVHGILGFAVDLHLIVQMGSGRTAGVAELAYFLSKFHFLTNLYRDRLEVRIAGVDTEAMIDLDHPTIVPHPAGVNNCSGRRRQDRRAGLVLEIEAVMLGTLAGEGIDAHAEAAHELIAVERRGQRQVAQDQLQLLPAADLAVELLDAGQHGALFRAAQRARDRDEGTALAVHLHGGGIEQAVDVEAGDDDGLLDLRH